MKRKATKPENAPAKPKAAADRTLHIKEPWSMTWMEYVDEMLAFLKTRIGPGHPLHRKRLYVSAVNKDADAWYVEGEKEDFYAIVYFSQKQRYGGKSRPKWESCRVGASVLHGFGGVWGEGFRKVWPRFTALKRAFPLPRH